MRNLLPLIVALSMMTPVNGAETVQVSADEWARPRHGEWVVEMASLRQGVGELGSGSGVIMVRHPEGEHGMLWAEEVVAWLVSLGVASAQIERRPGSERDDVLELWVQRKYEQE